jgi:hypothetical protein
VIRQAPREEAEIRVEIWSGLGWRSGVKWNLIGVLLVTLRNCQRRVRELTWVPQNGRGVSKIQTFCMQLSRGGGERERVSPTWSRPTYLPTYLPTYPTTPTLSTEAIPEIRTPTSVLLSETIPNLAYAEKSIVSYPRCHDICLFTNS